MTVKWFSINDVPKNRMWDSDKYWFDYVLQDRPFVIDFHFKNDKSDLFDKMTVNFVEDINEYIPENN